MIRKFLLLITISGAFFRLSYAQELIEKIKNLPGIISVEKMNNHQFFKEAYIIMIRQPLDHKRPESGTFPQRIMLSHLDYDEPVVFITEGYNVNNEAGPRYLNELCPILYANQLFVEHRYFGKSTPDSLNWEYLTIENAAADHHQIARIFKQIYSDKWINTGISKGGQATLYYRLLYPDDVAETVAYVAPLNFSDEEKRHDKFIRRKAGSSSERKRVENFQDEVLKRKGSLLPEFENYCNSKKYVFKAPFDEIFDYCVLEYSFSFWQWGHKVSEIPDYHSSDQEIFRHFMKVVSPDYFDCISGSTVMPFFVQAQRELGYYAYNPKPFKNLMQVKNTEDYLKKLFVPKEAVYDYRPEISIKLKRFLKKEAQNIMLIYGENDPWTASAAKTGRNRKITKIVMQDGCHLTRINTLPQSQRESAVRLLKEWLDQS